MRERQSTSYVWDKSSLGREGKGLETGIAIRVVKPIDKLCIVGMSAHRASEESETISFVIRFDRRCFSGRVLPAWLPRSIFDACATIQIRGESVVPRTTMGDVERIVLEYPRDTSVDLPDQVFETFRALHKNLGVIYWPFGVPRVTTERFIYAPEHSCCDANGWVPYGAFVASKHGAVPPWCKS